MCTRRCEPRYLCRGICHTLPENTHCNMWHYCRGVWYCHTQEAQYVARSGNFAARDGIVQTAMHDVGIWPIETRVVMPSRTLARCAAVAGETHPRFSCLSCPWSWIDIHHIEVSYLSLFKTTHMCMTRPRRGFQQCYGGCNLDHFTPTSEEGRRRSS